MIEHSKLPQKLTFTIKYGISKKSGLFGARYATLIDHETKEKFRGYPTFTDIEFSSDLVSNALIKMLVTKFSDEIDIVHASFGFYSEIPKWLDTTRKDLPHYKGVYYLDVLEYILNVLGYTYSLSFRTNHQLGITKISSIILEKVKYPKNVQFGYVNVFKKKFKNIINYDEDTNTFNDDGLVYNIKYSSCKEPKWLACRYHSGMWYLKDIRKKLKELEK